MAEPVVDSSYNSSFELRNAISDLDVDFELTFEDLYFPSENDSFFSPVDATNLEASGDCSVTAQSSADCFADKTSTTKRKKEIEEDRSKSYKYMRLDEDGVASDDEEKRNSRLVRNRESALLSRQRKKHYVEELEDKVKNLQSVINDMRQTVGYNGKDMCWPPVVPVTYPWMP